MNPVIEMVVYGGIGLLGLALQTTISLLRKPRWLIEDKSLEANWSRLAIISAIIGLVIMILALAISLSMNLHGQALAFAGPVGFAVAQSFVTDLRVRYVDRWTLRIAALASLAAGILVLSLYGVESDWVIYLVFAAVTLGIGFMPGIGDSDGRSFSILVLACYPTAAIPGLKWAFALIIVAVIVYYVVRSIREKNWNFRKLFAKLSFPMVPLILTPTLIVVLFGIFLPQF